MSGPRISAVIVVHNGERYLAAAIESALVQRPFETVVVDDGSTDASLEIARGFEPAVRCVTHARLGICAARNTGIATSTGDCVAFLDADDMWTPSALGFLSGTFGADPSLEAAFGCVQEFISPDVEELVATRLICHDRLEPGYLNGASLIHRGAFQRVGGFDEGLTTGDLLDWMARARELGLREVLVPEHVLWRRLHDANHGILRVDAGRDYVRVLKSALDRRRADHDELDEEAR